MPGYKDSPQLRGVGLFTTYSQADNVSAAVGQVGPCQEETPTRGPECPKVAPSPGPSSDHDRDLVGLEPGNGSCQGALAVPSSGSAMSISALLGSTIFPGDRQPWSALVDPAGHQGPHSSRLRPSTA